MASVATVWQLRPNGVDTNGGGFDPTTPSAGADWTKQDAAQYSLTGLTTSGAGNTVLTSLAAADWVGNYFQLNTVGTNFVLGFYRIVSVIVGTSFTVDNGTSAQIATGVGSGGAGTIGGAVKRLDKIAGTTSVATAGNIVWVLNGTYSNTTTQTIGCDGALAGGLIHIIGHNGNYQDTLGGIDETQMPIFTSAQSNINVITTNGLTRTRIKNLKVTHSGASRGFGFSNTSSGSQDIIYENCVVDGCQCGWIANTVSFSAMFIGCTVRNSTNATYGGYHLDITSSLVYMYNCTSYGNAGPGISCGRTTGGLFLICDECIFASNLSGGINIPITTPAVVNPYIFRNCIIWGNTGAGINSAATTGTIAVRLLNCIFGANSTYDINAVTASVSDFWISVNNAFWTTGTGKRNNVGGLIIGDITLSGNPFTNVSVKDFSLITTGAGLQCRALAVPAQIGVLNTVDETLTYRDIGPAQAQATSSGGFQPISSGAIR